MPQVSGGPKDLNSILESAYASARSQGHPKDHASAIAWGAAKQSYKKKGGKWVEKLYDDLSSLAMLIQDSLIKAPSVHEELSKLEYLEFAMLRLGEMLHYDLTKIDQGNPLMWLGVDDVMLNPEHDPLDEEFLKPCMDEIERTGKVKPLTYSLVDNNGVDQPMITDGFHRYHALKRLGYKFIPGRLSDERGTKTTDRDEPVALLNDDTEKMEKKKDKSVGVEWLPIDSFFLNPYHTPANRKIVDEKKDKILENKEVKPLLYSDIDNNGKTEQIIVDGYHRYIALKELGYKEIPVLKVGSQGLKISDTLKKVPVKKIKKEVASTDVNGLELVHEDLQSKPKKAKPVEMVIKFEKTWSDAAREASAEVRHAEGDLKPHSSEAHGSYFTRQHPDGKIETIYRPKEGAEQSLGMHSSMEEAENRIVNHKNSFLGEILPPQQRETEGSPMRGSGKGTTSGEYGSTRSQLKPLSGKEGAFGQGKHSGGEGGHEGHGHIFGHKTGKHTGEAVSEISQGHIQNKKPSSGTPLRDAKLPAPVGQEKVVDVDSGKQVTKDNFTVETNFEKGGPGSGRHSGTPYTHVDDLRSKIERHKNDLKAGKIDINTFTQRTQPLYNLVNRTEHGGSEGGETTRPIHVPVEKAWSDEAREASAAARHSGRDIGGKKPIGHAYSGDIDMTEHMKEKKAFAEPFHSKSHIQQFLGSNNVVIGSVDKGNLSPEKNALRQKQFEQDLDRWGYHYKKGNGVSSQWGNEATYIIGAPKKEDADTLHHTLTRGWKQDAVIHVRNGHATMNFNGGTNEPTKHANVNSALEAGDHLNDNYTSVDGHKFRINFK